jgi:nitrous oxide reductase accessory protein NosL
MFVIFHNSIAIACFSKQEDAVDYWRENGGTIILYPEMKQEDILIR